jgi:hypothetical protein
MKATIITLFCIAIGGRLRSEAILNLMTPSPSKLEYKLCTLLLTSACCTDIILIVDSSESITADGFAAVRLWNWDNIAKMCADTKLHSKQLHTAIYVLTNNSTTRCACLQRLRDHQWFVRFYGRATGQCASTEQSQLVGVLRWTDKYECVREMTYDFNHKMTHTFCCLVASWPPNVFSPVSRAIAPACQRQSYISQTDGRKVKTKNRFHQFMSQTQRKIFRPGVNGGTDT